MSHKGNPKIHSHAAYGVETKRSLSLSDIEIAFIKEFNRTIIIEWDMWKSFEIVKNLNELNKKSIKKISNAIMVLLIANAPKIKRQIANADLYSRIIYREDLYLIISALDISDKEYNLLIKLFDLEDIRELDNYYQNLLNNPALSKYHKEFNNLFNVEILNTLGISDKKHHLIEILLRVYSSAQQSQQYLRQKSIIPFSNVEFEYFIYLKSFLETYKTLFNLLSNYYNQKNLKAFADYYNAHRNEFQQFYSPPVKDFIKAKRYDKFITSLLAYYNNQPLEAIPRPILPLLLIYDKTKIQKKSQQYIISNPSLKHKFPTEEAFNEFVQSSINGLPTNSKEPLEGLFKLLLNIHKYLSQELSTREMDALQFLLSMENIKNSSEIFDIPMKIDYLNYFLTNKKDLIGSLNSYGFYKKGYMRNAITHKNVYTLKYLLY